MEGCWGDAGAQAAGVNQGQGPAAELHVGDRYQHTGLNLIARGLAREKYTRSFLTLVERNIFHSLKGLCLYVFHSLHGLTFVSHVV